ncbi:hypothetical protein [Bacteroides ovatus]|uniref:hypothetical protein n=1 Tax=Bacteroides ovatus TaxID=28116 RepID=UPI0032199ECD
MKQKSFNIFLFLFSILGVESYGQNRLPDTEVIHVLAYGQSLASASYSGDIITKKQKADNLFRFIGGVRTSDVFSINMKGYSQVERKKSQAYKELINYTTSLSEKDIALQNYKYSILVPLTEVRPYYSPVYIGGNDSIVRYDYINPGESIPSGSRMMIHADGETPISGCLEMINTLLQTESTKKFEWLGSCPAFGSARFLSLWPYDKGGKTHTQLEQYATGSNLNYFEVLMADVYYAKQYYDRIGKSYSVGAVLYYHEHLDLPDSIPIKFRERRLLQLFYLINERIKEITGQQNDVIIVNHQSLLSSYQAMGQYHCSIEDTPTIYDDKKKLAVLGNKTEKEYCDSMPNADVPEYDKQNVIMGTPVYPYPYASDYIHLTSVGSKMSGIAQGYALKKTMFDMGGKWKPIHPLKHQIKRKKIKENNVYILTVEFHLDQAPLVLDENAVHGIAQSIEAKERGDKYGFILKDKNGRFIPFDSVEVNGNSLVFISSVNPIGCYLNYAINYAYGTGYENKSKRPFGNLRDSRGDKIQTELIENEWIPVHNWSPAFSYYIQ